MRLKPRRWIAWKLVQLAWRICDTEFEQTITITPWPTGHEIIINILGDLYGGGISSTSGIPWMPDENNAMIMTAEVNGYHFRWEDSG